MVGPHLSAVLPRKTSFSEVGRGDDALRFRPSRIQRPRRVGLVEETLARSPACHRNDDPAKSNGRKHCQGFFSFSDAVLFFSFMPWFFIFVSRLVERIQPTAFACDV